MSSVTYEHVTKRFETVLAVDDLSLEIADGEFLVLLGPSGCGKSTALRMLAGLETLTEGNISIGEQVVNDIDPRHRDVAMVFQSYALYPHMTVAKNIESPLIGHRQDQTDKAERRELVERTAKMLGLEDLLDRKPSQLSGGQRQRVALARAIVRRPAVFLMDEPLSNLDAKLRTQTRAELVNLHKELDATFVYVTHDQIEAMTMASRIAVLDEGRLLQVGDPRAIYDTPANLFVARFIGSPSMNVLSGTVRVGESGERFVSVSGGELGVGSRWQALSEGQTVEVGVRPEHLRVSSDGGFPAAVTSAEWLGSETIIQFDAGGEHIALRDGSDAVDLAPGTSVRLTAGVDDIHLFDSQSGERLTKTQP
jgi:ABC-type sugar transport system ATPase subunit